MNLKSWFTSLASREQAIVALLGLVVIGGGLYLFAIEPLTRGIADRRVSVASKQNDLAQMQVQANAVKAAGRSSGNGPKRKMEKAPYLLLDEAIRKAKIKSPDRVEPAGERGAKAQFSEVQFDKLVEVLGQLEQTYGLAVKTVNLSRKGEGLVSARVSLEVGQ